MTGAIEASSSLPLAPTISVTDAKNKMKKDQEFVIRLPMNSASYYVVNVALVYAVVALFYLVSTVQIYLYYALKVAVYTIVILSRWTDIHRHAYVDRLDRFVSGILPVLWILVHAVTHTLTCHTSDMMRSNMWLDIIVHTSSAFLTLFTFLYHQPKGVRGGKWAKAYLIMVCLYCVASIVIATFYVKTPEDGDRLALWWIGSALSFVDFTTVNIYDQPIFSKRLLVEFLVGAAVFVTQVTRIIPTHSFIYVRYFETYLLGALFCVHYIDFDRLINEPSSTPEVAAEVFHRVRRNSILVSSDLAEVKRNSLKVVNDIERLRSNSITMLQDNIRRFRTSSSARDEIVEKDD